jgi:hypothetical protein
MREDFKDSAHRDKIIERIRILLATSKGTSFEAEAATALRMAQEHMAKYGLSLSEVGLQKELREEIKEEELKDHTKRSSPEKWEIPLARAVATVLDCTVIRRVRNWQNEKILVFVGYKKDVEMAKVIFNTLFIATRVAACKELPQAKGYRRMDQLSFMLGVAERLAERALEEKEKIKEVPSNNQFALMVVGKEKSIENWMKENFNLKKPKASRGITINSIAYNRGREYANTMDLMNREKLNYRSVQ